MPNLAILAKKILPFLKQKVKREDTHKIDMHSLWWYGDLERKIRNPIVPTTRFAPHFVLRDSTGKPRVVIGFEVHGTNINIYAIQRMRTQYSQDAEGKFWDAKKETEESKKFRQELGQHPSDFILVEFIKYFKKQINQGFDVKLHFSEDEAKNYYDLVNRFFENKPDNLGFYHLSKTKTRVKQILESNE